MINIEEGEKKGQYLKHSQIWKTLKGPILTMRIAWHRILIPRLTVVWFGITE